MDVREKLVELLDDIQRGGEDYTDYEIYGMRVPDTVSNEDVADHLIAHGVTVQEWHSVNDCMPEDLEENKCKKVINCIVEHDTYGNGKTTTQFRQRKYDSYYKEWRWSKIGGCTVTRWTMMPQPPKGE
jgi:hypothetical protein